MNSSGFPGAIFEPGHGSDLGPNGETRGGYVLDIGQLGFLPAGWYRDKKRSQVTYSPGHVMRIMLDPELAGTPRPDLMFPGHQFTYEPNPELGYVIPKHLRGIDYYVAITHPWAATTNEADEAELSRRMQATQVGVTAAHLARLQRQSDSLLMLAAYLAWSNTFRSN